MKKTITVYAFAMCASLFFTTGISAQAINGIKFSETVSSASKMSNAKASSDKEALGRIRSFSEKTFRKFTSAYPSASNLKIRTNNKGMHITCNINDSVVRAMYNKNGRSLYSVLYYSSSELPQSIVDQVEYFFPGYTVYGPVTDVTVNFKTARLILIENKKTWKRVRMIGDDIDVYEEHTKDL